MIESSEIPRKKILEVSYAAKNTSLDVLKKSSSGGIISPLVEAVLDDGGAVVCSVYNYTNNQLEFRLLSTREQMEEIRGSKYIQSKPLNIFKDSEIWLKNHQDRHLLFVGTGCQAQAFIRYMKIKGLYDRVFIVDLICHGVSSPKIWKEYVTEKQKNANGKIEYLTFKDKRNGWLKPTAFIRIKGKEVSIDSYVKMYHSKNIMRPSCYDCKYTKIERESDLTVGDFWKVKQNLPEAYDRLGVSTILVHTSTGQELLQRVKYKLEMRECPIDDCLQDNLEHPTACPNTRDNFWKIYCSKGICGVVNQYGKMSILKKMLKKLTIRL